MSADLSPWSKLWSINHDPSPFLSINFFVIALSWCCSNLEAYCECCLCEINDLDLCLEVVSRSCQLLRYIQRWISLYRKPLDIDAWFQRTTNRNSIIMGYQTVTWPMTSRDLERSNSWHQFLRLERNISKTTGFIDSVPKDQ